MEKILKNLPVAVGVIFNSDQEVLLAWRNILKNQGGCWEFPGGKIEPGEDSYQALCRELSEEIDITVQNAKSLPAVNYTYETYQVTLYPWLVLEYVGVPRGVDGQDIIWCSLGSLQKLTLPKANYLIVEHLYSLHSPKSVPL